MSKVQPRKNEAQLFPTVLSLCSLSAAKFTLSFKKVKGLVISLLNKVYVVLTSAIAKAFIYS